ncbi:hypothetical protein QX204_07170 [Nocardia sp. PE-7]|uniref:hypothetical protein n=1 Tax=Nocardia sp. PE-7 TaxID=3058426 RepID=UPI0026589D64|nr:hypothetical protein [Nocardia sp. PE-7]WKG11239.1 hypothetical protein QX204_07170 [Nocardia sp. PE-7]
MSTDSQSERHGHDGFAEFTEELRLLSEVLLARVEPVLRRTAADGRADLGGCAWCPVCAAAALVRGDHHDVVAALAEHGTSLVTVLREALAGIPVEPVLPPEWADHAAGHPDSTDGPGARVRAARPAPDPTAAGPSGEHPASGQREHAAAAQADADGGPRRGTSRKNAAGAPRPRRVDEYSAPRTSRTPQAPHIAPESADAVANASGTGAFATTEDRSATARAPRSHYVDIPVTIRG